MSPIITIMIWQLNNKSRDKREKIYVSARISRLLYDFSMNFKETETQEIRYQTAKTIDKEKFKDKLEHVRLTLNSMNKERSSIKAEIVEMISKLGYYMSESKREKLKELIAPLDKLLIRRFGDDFKEILPAQAEAFGKELEKKMNDGFYTIGCGKTCNDIAKFLKQEIYPLPS